MIPLFEGVERHEQVVSEHAVHDAVVILKVQKREKVFEDRAGRAPTLDLVKRSNLFHS